MVLLDIILGQDFPTPYFFSFFHLTQNCWAFSAILKLTCIIKLFQNTNWEWCHAKTHLKTSVSREIPQTALFWRRYPRLALVPPSFLVALVCTGQVPGITSAITKNRGKTTGIPQKAGLRNLSNTLPN